MQEVWKHGNSTIYLICEYVNNGNYEFTAKPADLDSAEAAKVLMKLSKLVYLVVIVFILVITWFLD